MISAEATFQIGDTVVYAMQGIGRIKSIVTRTTEGRQRGFYQIELEKNKGEVLVPVEDAAALGLRHALPASEVPQVLQRLQRAASRPALRGQSEHHYCGVSSACGKDRRWVWRRCDASCMISNRSRVSLTSVYVSSAPMCTPSYPQKLLRRWDAP